MRRNGCGAWRGGAGVRRPPRWRVGTWTHAAWRPALGLQAPAQMALHVATLHGGPGLGRGANWSEQLGCPAMTGCRIPREGPGGRGDALRPLVMNWRDRTVGPSLGARRASSHTVSPPQPLRHVLVFPGTFPNPGTCPALHAQPAATAAVAAAAVGKMGVLGLQGPPQGGHKCQGAARGWEEGQWLARRCSCCCPCPCLALLVASMYTRLFVPRGQGPSLYSRAPGCSFWCPSWLSAPLAACPELSLLMSACWAEKHVGPGWDGCPSDPALPGLGLQPLCVVLGRGGFWGAGWFEPSPVGPFNYTGLPQEACCKQAQCLV